MATGHTSVDAVVSTIAYGCIPMQGGVTVTGIQITLRFDAIMPPGSGCADSVFPFTSTFHLGILPPGLYDVAERLDTNSGAFTQARAKLIVRDDSLTAPPFAVSTTGGEFIVLRTSDTTGRVVVAVDGQAATLVRNEAAGNVYLAPPHAPGTVDITVASASTYRTAVAALTYFDRKAPPDPALFELILFPTSFEGPGVFGTRWTTENDIAAGENGPVRFRDALPCSSCTDLLTTAAALRNDQNPAGLALYALRGTASQLMTFAALDLTSYFQHLPSGATSAYIYFQRDPRLRCTNVGIDQHHERHPTSDDCLAVRQWIRRLVNWAIHEFTNH